MKLMPAKAIPPHVAQQFFDQVEGLEVDYVRSKDRSRRTAWRVAGVAVGLAFLESFAIASLAPIHTVEWRLVRVDSAGPVEVVTTLDKTGQVFTDANARFYLAEYVRMRESYYEPEAAYNYHAVSLMSEPNEQRRYGEAFRGSNPNSPQVFFGKGGYQRVYVEATSVLAPGLGRVEFTKEEHQDVSSNAKVTHWVATIGYSLNTKAVMSNADRVINPLGFQVVSYHVDAVQR